MRRLTVPLIVAVGVSIAACSGGDDDSTASSTLALSSTVATTPQVTEPEQTDPDAAATVPTTDASSTTETPPATEAPTTTSPQSRAIEELAGFQQSGDRAGLALFAPLSPAYVYYEGLVLLAEHGDPFPDSRTTAIDGGFRISQSGGGSTVTLDNFVFDDTGLIVDFNRNDVPLSTTVVGLGYAVEAGQLTGLVHSARLFDGVLQVVMQSTNGSTEDSSFYVDSYVQADGRQLEASPTTSLSNTIRPGATVAYLYVVEDAAFGGTLFGQLAGGSTDFVYADVEVAVPAPG